MSATKINCNFPGCTESFETREAFHAHIEEAKHHETIHVIVRNLTYSLTNEDLQKEFAQFNPREVRIATRKDGKSKGFGLAFFNKAEDRDAAIAALNGKELAGRKIRVSIGKPRTGAETIAYVGKFEKAPSEEELKAAFSGLAITKVEIVSNEGKPAFAYITFADAENFKKALEAKTVLGANVEPKRRVRAPRNIKKAAAAATPKKTAETPKKAAETPREPFVKNTVHVGKLPEGATKEQLSELFASLNPTSVRIVSRKARARFPAYTYGVVAFANEEEYNKALEVKKLGEQDIIVDPKRSAARRRRNAKPAAAAAGSAPAPRRLRRSANTLKDTLFVGKLPDVITDEGLKEIFEGCAFTAAKIHEGKKGKYGVVAFASNEDAQKALETVKGTSVEGVEILVEFKRDTTPAKAAAAETPKN